jgi:hypothetical protein
MPEPVALFVGGGPAEDEAALRAAFAPAAELVVPDAGLVAALDLEDAGSAQQALRDALGGCPVVAAVVQPPPGEVAALAQAVDAALDPLVAAVRSAFLWMRALAGAFGDAGGALVLPIPQAAYGPFASSVAAHALLGLARTASVSLAPGGVRCHAVVRQAGDATTFARLAAVLATPRLDWLSGHLLATSATDLTLFTPDEPRWQVFAEPRLGPAWSERVEGFLRRERSGA